MRGVFAAAEAGTTAYPGEGAAEQTRPAQRLAPVPGPRRASSGAKDGVDAVVQRWALRPRRPRCCPHGRRRAARTPRSSSGGGTLGAARRRADGDGRVAVRGRDRRDGRGDGRPRATRRGRDARGGQGLEPPPTPRRATRTPGREGELAVLADDLGARLEALRRRSTPPRGVVAAPRDWLVDLGLDGRGPATPSLEAARPRGRRATRTRRGPAPRRPAATLAAAPGAGRARAIDDRRGGRRVARCSCSWRVVLLVVGRRRGRGRRSGRPGGAGAVRYTPGPRRPGRAHGRPGARRRRSPQSVTAASAAVPGPR